MRRGSLDKWVHATFSQSVVGGLGKGLKARLGEGKPLWRRLGEAIEVGEGLEKPLKLKRISLFGEAID